MSDNQMIQNIIHTTITIPQRVIRYISSAVIQIFSPSDNNYPPTGVQPFEGDPVDEKPP